MAEQKTGFSLTPSTWVDVTFSSDQVTVRGDGNVLIPSFRKQFLPLVSPPHPHNAEPAALMLDPFCLVFFFASFYLRDTANHDVGDSFKKKKRQNKRDREKYYKHWRDTKKKKKKRAEKNCLKLQKAEHEQNGAASKLKCCSRKQEELEGMGRIIYKAPL